MSIVTKKGDKGQTALYGGERVSKSCARVDSYGEVDELGAFLGFARTLGLGAALEAVVVRIQTELLTVGAVLATPPEKKAAAAKVGPVSPAWVLRMEEEAAALEKALVPLRQFVLPGAGAQAGAALHLARTVARRAERKAVALSQQEEVPGELLVYLNRLSDLLFLMARAADELPAPLESLA